MKEEINTVHGETGKLRKNLLWERTKNKDLTKENAVLKQKLACYRRAQGEQLDLNNTKGGKGKSPKKKMSKDESNYGDSIPSESILMDSPSPLRPYK